PEGDEGVDVVGGRQPDRVDPTDLADVLANLRRVGDTDADELERRMAHDLGDDHLADEARAPDDDALGHQCITSPAFTMRCWPVTALARSEAKKMATSATSPSSVMRRNGNLPTMSCSTSSVEMPLCWALASTNACTGGPHIHEGTTILQRMLSAPSSSAR